MPDDAAVAVARDASVNDKAGAKAIRASRRMSRDAAVAALWPAPDAGASLVLPSESERAAFGRLIAALFRAHSSAELEGSDAGVLAAGLGIRIERWQVGDASFWVAQDKRERGVGRFVVRIKRARGAGRPILLQAPHAFFEVGTRDIAAELFFGPGGERYAALFTNSLHRYQPVPGPRVVRPDSPADVCHSPSHWFNPATGAALRSLHDPVVVQLHGYSAKRYNTLADAYAIVSGGDRAAPTKMSVALANRLTPAFGPGALVFARDTGVLGGTKNQQRQLVLAHGESAFLHIEMSMPLREQLTAGGSTEALSSAIVGAVDSVQPATVPRTDGGSPAIDAGSPVHDGGPRARDGGAP